MSEEIESKGRGRDAPPAAWERETLEKVLLASVREQRQARLWGFAFKGALLVYLVVVAVLALRPVGGFFGHSASKKHTAVVDVAGTIMEGNPADADNLIEGLRDAVEDKGTKGILLRMNSPGGSPVQSAYVWAEIRRIKKEKPELPIHAVVADLCASGCYYIASAADRIYVSPASVVGSIGVIMGSFGFVDTMKMLGVERRIMTAGEHKALLDPFAPVDPVARQHMQGVLGQVHQQFIDAVRQGRGQRLKENPQMFSGLIWTGAEGITLGLADELGDTRQVAEKVIGAEKLIDFNPDENMLDRLSRRFGAAVGGVLLESLMGGLGAPR